jgi:hypothetical protein
VCRAASPSSSNEILEALTDPLNQHRFGRQNALEQTPPELGADIADRGMMLTGGGALLRDLDRLLAEETGLPVLVAEDPLTCVVRGCGIALERMERLGSIFTNGSPMGVGGALELKFVPSGTDMQKGDLLTTSGIDGIYPPGLHVGRISQIDRRVDASFATVHAEPTAIERGRHLLVLLPVKDWPAKPVADKTPNPPSKSKAANKPPQSANTAGGTP